MLQLRSILYQLKEAGQELTLAGRTGGVDETRQMAYGVRVHALAARGLQAIDEYNAEQALLATPAPAIPAAPRIQPPPMYQPSLEIGLQ